MSLRRSVSLRAVLVVLAGSVLVPAGASPQVAYEPAPSYTLTNITEAVGGGQVYLRALNDDGLMVGQVSTQTDVRAISYGDGVLTDLGSLGGAYGGSAMAVNNGGLIVGYSTTPDGSYGAFVYDGVMHAIPGLLTPFALANSVNDAGDIVGDTNNLAYLYRNGVVSWLGTLGGEYSQAYGGAWVDRTVSHDYATGQICAEVSSLSPFVIAPLNASFQVASLIEDRKPFKSGTTAPIKLRVLGAGGVNVSSPLVTVHAKRLVRVPSGARITLEDAGRSNPEGAFRYDAASAGYVFTLSTKGLAAGIYELTVRVAGDPIPKALTFDVR